MPFITSKAAGGFGCVYSVITSSGTVSNSVAGGEQLYTTPGTFTWTCPTGVNIISVLCVGGGGGGVFRSGGAGAGGGGGLGWKNNILVTPGQNYTIVVGSGGTSSATAAGAGGNSYFTNTSTVAGLGGSGANLAAGGSGGSYAGDGGGAGGTGGTVSSGSGGGGGGAAGYTGTGGAGGGTGAAGADGTGGGAGGGGANGGGGSRSGGAGVGVYGQGTNGTGGGYNATSSATVAKGGSGGQDGQASGSAIYGGGGAGTSSTNGSNVGGAGAVRIIWAGPPTRPTRTFPSTRVIAQGYSVLFNGSNQYLSVPHNTALNPATSTFTLECWVYISSFSAFNHIYNKGGGSANGFYFGVNTSGLLFGEFRSSSNVATTITGTTPLTLNTWTHVAFTRGTSNVTNLWKDGGKEGADATIATSVSPTADLRVALGAGSSTEYFNGYISNLRFVKGAALYTANFTPPTSSLGIAGTGTTNLLTCKNTTIIDESSNAFVITAYNTPTVSTSNAWF